YGYGQGAGTLSMDTGDSTNGPPTSNIPATAQAFIAPKRGPPSPQPQTNGTNRPVFGGADVCPRCGKAVYMAEKMMGGGSHVMAKCMDRKAMASEAVQEFCKILSNKGVKRIPHSYQQYF
ncbi:unnamed protein product, partial [Medioppia subpectinata]